MLGVRKLLLWFWKPSPKAAKRGLTRRCVQRVRLLTTTDKVVDCLQHTKHRKIHPIKLDGFNQNCE